MKSIPTPLDKTFRYLATTENAAAAQIVRLALASTFALIREKALEAAVRMNHPGLLRGAFLSYARDAQSLETAACDNPDQLAKLAGRIVQSRDPAMGAKACQMIANHKLYGAIPALVSKMHDPRDPLLAIAADTVFDLADALHEEMVHADESYARRDLERKRDWMTHQLEQTIHSFKSHAKSKPIEAFLVVAKRENNTLLKVLEDSKSDCHEPAVKILETSMHGGVIRLLLSFLTSRHAPAAVDRVISGRDDVRFVKNLVAMTGATPTKEIAQHLARFHSISWAIPGHPIFSELAPELHPNALAFLRHSAVGREAILEILQYFFEDGGTPGRRAAAQVLNQYHGPEADQLAKRGLVDADPQVRATMIRQFRGRNVPDAVAILTRIASERTEAEVSDALRDALPEFSLQSFLSRFDQMSDAVSVKLAVLVRNIDRDAPQRLAEEMANISPVRRRRAVQAAELMGFVAELELHIIGLVADEDHRVRQVACESLSRIATRRAFEALRGAMADRSIAVQRAARQSLASIYKRLMCKKTQPLVEAGSAP